jgi:CheY-like chemotaxis protein
MNEETETRQTILVVEDVEEIRDGIEKLLSVDGYRVQTARGERDAVECAGGKYPDLILVGLGEPPREVIETARRIRERAKLDEKVPIVIFSTDEVAEGAEVAIGQNVYLTDPDNFDQLRRLIARLLHDIPTIAKSRN